MLWSAEVHDSRTGLQVRLHFLFWSGQILQGRDTGDGWTSVTSVQLDSVSKWTEKLKHKRVAAAPAGLTKKKTTRYQTRVFFFLGYARGYDQMKIHSDAKKFTVQKTTRKKWTDREREKWENTPGIEKKTGFSFSSETTNL